MVRNSSFNDRSFQIHPTIFGIRSDKNQEEKGKKKEKRTKGKDRISPWIEEAFAEATARFRSHEIQASAPNGGRISHCTLASKPRFGSCVCRTTEVSGHESIDSSFLAQHAHPPPSGGQHSATRDRLVLRVSSTISCIMAVEAWWLRHVGNEAGWMDAHPSSAHPFVRPRYPITGHAPLPPRLTFLRRYGDGMNTETRPVFEICCATLPLSRVTSCRIEVACNFTMLASIGFVGVQARDQRGIHVSVNGVRTDNLIIRGNLQHDRNRGCISVSI